MPETADEDNERHRREEAERRAKRKASKSSRSSSQQEKDRKRKEYRHEILKQQGSDVRSVKKPKTGKEPTGSAFQDLFTQRAQGFQIEFRFRNAPPRPPVGPCFVGNSLDTELLEQAKVYKFHNAVEVNHTWKLHNEPDIGVPLGSFAMDVKSYKSSDETATLHPDDEALLNWTGSLGDTAADQLKHRQEQARAAARLVASGRSPVSIPNRPQQKTSKKKVFSRVLKEDMQPWMKKTTYLSNDYSRKVHDFKSLAQTKSELAADLQRKQEEMASRRSAKAISKSFESTKLQHPTNKDLKPVNVMPVLPAVKYWGRAFTHLVIDKAPNMDNLRDLEQGIVNNVEKRSTNARMTCDLEVPDNDDNNEHYKSRFSYDLDVVPLKEQDMPHVNFCLLVDGEQNLVSYIPMASRVQLSTGRPSKTLVQRVVERRPLTDKEFDDMEERMAQVDQELAENHHVNSSPTEIDHKKNVDDGEDDFDNDSDDSDEEVFGSGTKTIVAES